MGAPDTGRVWCPLPCRGRCLRWAWVRRRAWRWRRSRRHPSSPRRGRSPTRPGRPELSRMSTWSSTRSRKRTTTSICRDGSAPSSDVSSRPHWVDGPSVSASGVKGSGVPNNDPLRGGMRYVAPVSRGQRSAACTATASVPADERNIGTADNDAANTAHAPAVAASTAGRRHSSQGARRQGTELRVPSAARARTRHEATRAFILSDKVRVRRVTKHLILPDHKTTSRADRWLGPRLGPRLRT